jgi:hypothetical protein
MTTATRHRQRQFAGSTILRKMTSAEPIYPYGRHLRSLAELGLPDDQLARLAVADAQGAIRSLVALGLEATEELQQRAAGDPKLVAAYVARYSTNRAADVT